MRKFGIVLMIGIAILTACDKKSSTAATKETTEAPKYSEAPKPDLSTPEKAIYSYQAFKNWSNEVINAVSIKNYSEHEAKVAPVKFAHFNDRTVQIFKQHDDYIHKNPADKYEFSIIEMKKETDTRVVAIVNIRNVTPIPSDVVPSENDIKQRADGFKFKFELELENSKWLISQITKWEEYSKVWSYPIKKREPSANTHVYLN